MTALLGGPALRVGTSWCGTGRAGAVGFGIIGIFRINILLGIVILLGIIGIIGIIGIFVIVIGGRAGNTCHPFCIR
jgi:hypothetical protein